MSSIFFLQELQNVIMNNVNKQIKNVKTIFLYISVLKISLFNTLIQYHAQYNINLNYITFLLFTIKMRTFKYIYNS